MTKYLLSSLMFGTLLFPLSSSAAESDRDQITIVLPALSGSPTLGKAVAAMLKLRIAQSFRLKDPKRPSANLGRGSTYFVPTPLESSSHAEAERLARVNGAQLVLWGNVRSFGKGAAAQTYLTIAEPYLDFRENSNEAWSVKFRERSLQLDFPRRRISFAAITFPPDQVDQFSSDNYLQLCRTKTKLSCISAGADSEYRVLAWEGENLARVRLQRQDWWLEVPTLEDNNSQAIHFTAGILAFFRGDWNAVLAQMQLVLDGPRATELKVDANIYRGIAKFKLGTSGTPDLQAAYEIAPFSARAIQYLAMGLLEEALRQSSGSSNRQTAARAASSYLQGNRKLFRPDDPWIETAIRMAEELGS